MDTKKSHFYAEAQAKEHMLQSQLNNSAGFAGSTKAEVEVEQRDIPYQLAKLRDRVDGTVGIVAYLRDRLSPMLRAGAPNGSAQAGKPTPANSTQFGNALREITSQSEEANTSLQDILDRLEL